MREHEPRITNEHDRYETPSRHLSIDRGRRDAELRDDDADATGLADRDDTPPSDTALRLHPGLDARDVDIYVAQGEVTLLGVVNSFREEQLAIDLAHRTPGIVSVMSQLRLAIVPLETPDDN
jgi:hypothetical protein